jgi:hypothetical protein
MPPHREMTALYSEGVDAMRFPTTWKTALPAVVLGLVAGAGCAQKDAGGSSTSTTPLAVTGGMYCPKCETVWVHQPVAQGTKVARLQSEKKMQCPTCDSTAASYLTSDGKVQMHECPDCKATPMPLQP